jgi:hypothetical protein
MKRFVVLVLAALAFAAVSADISAEEIDQELAKEFPDLNDVAADVEVAEVEGGDDSVEEDEEVPEDDSDESGDEDLAEEEDIEVEDGCCVLPAL